MCLGKKNDDLLHFEYLTTKIHENEQNVIKIQKTGQKVLTSDNLKHSNFKMLTISI